MASIATYLSSCLLLLFTFSGMMKWIPVFYVDPTIIFGCGLIIFILSKIRYGIPRYTNNQQIAILGVISFILFYFITTNYTISDGFWMRKAMTLGLNLLAFVFPLLCFNTKAHFMIFSKLLILYSLIIICFVLTLYLTGNLYILLNISKGVDDVKFPDYLVLGYAIGLGAIACMANVKITNIIIVLLSISSLLILGSRGPFLFLGLMICMNFILRRRQFIVLLKNSILYLIVIALVIMVLFYNKSTEIAPGGQNSLNRFTALFDDDTTREKALRFQEFMIAMDVIADFPLLGVGLGGYGIAGYGEDDNIYPHNIVLEAFAESGVVGLLLFCLSIVLVMRFSIINCKSNEGITYFLLLTFTLLNYLKSGGFVGARDLYMFMGLSISYAKVCLRDVKSVTCNIDKDVCPVTRGS